MKALLSYLFILAITFALFSCNQRKSVEVTTEAEKITTSDSSAVVPRTDSIDSVSVDPKVSETAMQSDPPPATPSKPKECQPNFNLLGKPARNQYVFYVSGFNPGEFKCWVDLEKHGATTCGENPCVIFYVDKANVTITKTPPDYLSSTTLQTAGIGKFVHNGRYWELNGAKKWKRSGSGYGYYNTNNQAGG